MSMNAYGTNESGYYPPGAEFDPRAPWNDRGDDQEDTWDLAEREIELLTGEDLYNYHGVSLDDDLDVLENMPKTMFDNYDYKRSWDELPPSEKSLWEAYAKVRREFAWMLLSEDGVQSAVADGEW